MSIKHFPAPAGIKAPPLSFAAKSGELLFISGIPGFDAQGNLPEKFEAQFANVVTNIKAILDQAGVTFRDLAGRGIGRLRRPFLRTPKRSFGYVASQMRSG